MTDLWWLNISLPTSGSSHQPDRKAGETPVPRSTCSSPLLSPLLSPGSAGLPASVCPS